MTERHGAEFESVGSTSLSLIERVKTHDQDAWRRLVRLYGPLVQYWLSQTGLQTADIHDLIQEVFVAVGRGLKQFRKDRPNDTFRGWLRTIVRSKVADHFRRLGAQPAATGGSELFKQLPAIEMPEEPSDDGGERRYVRQFRLRALEMIRAEFEERTWEAFWRVAVEGQSPKDVAAEFGVTASAVRLAKSRVLRRLREELGDF
jgi:RNA polymerase sigma-70 factor (ECF subfamily)